MTSETTERARTFVAEHIPQARGLGQALGELIDDPEQFVRVLREGLAALADPVYADAQEHVAPGSGAVFGVRNPLLTAAARQLREPLRESSPSSALWLADLLVGEEEREIVLIAHVALLRALPDEPEQTWQLMRRLARRAHEWISVDSLAELYARGILREPFRWAELEQLVYSASRWERRLVGSTVARLPYELARHQRATLQASPGLTLVKSLIGDADADVQKALSWALRSWLEVDRQGVRGFIREQADIARRDDDGHRAWVLRDALSAPSTDRSFAAEIRATLEGLRRRSDQPSTSAAAAVAGAFAGYERLTERALAEQGLRQRVGTRG